MTWARAHWKLLLAVMIVALIGIQLFEPDYNKLQTAKDADAFRTVLGDERGRAIGANLSDFVFAAAYGVLGVIAFRALARGRASFGVAAIAGGALADEIENVLVLINLSRSDTTTDGWIDAMRGVGVIKTTLLLVSLGAFAGLAILRLARRRQSE